MKKEKVCWALSLLIVATLILAEVSLVSHVSAQGSDPPIEIHLTWNQNDTTSTIVVTWKTRTENAENIVHYDTKSGGGDPSQYLSSKTGSNHTYSGAGGYIHDVELTELLPNTVYYFICGGDNGGWSAERKFQTGPDHRTSITFVAGGDSRDNPSARDAVSRAMAKFNPSFVLYSGDTVSTGTNQALWDDWFTAMDNIWVTENGGLTIPIIPILGNHEGMATNYFKQYSLPGNEQWFSIDWGPDLHIIALNNYGGVTGEQLDWLKSDLAEHENYPWKVVLFHEPAFSSSSHGSSASVQKYWVPLFDNYHVDLAISGHDHDYERTYPINYSISRENYQPSPENGTVYIVSGGWGAPLYGVGSNWWTAYSQSTYNFVVVNISNNGTLSTLHLQAVGTDGKTFDEYSIYKKILAQGGQEGKVPIAAIIVIILIVVIVCAGVASYRLKGRRKS